MPGGNRIEETGAIASSSNVPLRSDDAISDLCGLANEEGNTFERVNVKHSSDVKIGCTSNYYYGNITQILSSSEQSAPHTSSSSENENTARTDDEELQTVPYLVPLRNTEKADVSLCLDDDETIYSAKDYLINLRVDEEDILRRVRKKQGISIENMSFIDRTERNTKIILITGLTFCLILFSLVSYYCLHKMKTC